MSNTTTTTHQAWRFIGNGINYVQTINRTGTGDKYSYTDKVDRALSMSEHQCKAFCAYMKQCSTVGFWS
jgi:hypothetical protein